MGVNTSDFAENHALLAKLANTSFSGEINLSSYVDVSKYNRIAIVLYALAVGSSLDCDIEVSAAAAGTSPRTVKSITQLDGADDGAVVLIDVQASELPANGIDYRYLNVELTPSGSTSAVVLVFGFEPRYEPVDQTSYAEVVS